MPEPLTYYIISDLHLGSCHCQHHDLNKFLDFIEPRHQILIVAGDIYHCHPAEMPTEHQVILNRLQILRRKGEAVFLSGNHDHNVLDKSEQRRENFVPSYTLHTLTRTILITHGDKFDTFLPFQSLIKTLLQIVKRCLERIKHNPLHVADFAHQLCPPLYRIFLNMHIKRARIAAHEYLADTVICGHIHAFMHLQDKPEYLNPGSWTSSEPGYIEITQTTVHLKRWQ